MHQQEQLAVFTFPIFFSLLFFFKAGAEVIQQEKKQQPTIKKAEPMGRFGRKPYSSNTEEMEETPTIRILDIPRNTSFQDLLQLVTFFFWFVF